MITCILELFIGMFIVIPLFCYCATVLIDEFARMWKESKCKVIAIIAACMIIPNIGNILRMLGIQC